MGNSVVEFDERKERLCTRNQSSIWTSGAEILSGRADPSLRGRWAFFCGDNLAKPVFYSSFTATPVLSTYPWQFYVTTCAHLPSNLQLSCWLFSLSDPGDSHPKVKGQFLRRQVLSPRGYSELCTKGPTRLDCSCLQRIFAFLRMLSRVWRPSGCLLRYADECDDLPMLWDIGTFEVIGDIDLHNTGGRNHVKIAVL